MAANQGSRNPTQWLAVVAAAAAFCTVGIRTITSSAFWRHLAQGRYISQSGLPHVDPFSFPQGGQPWVDTTWLYDRLLYACWGVGGAGLVTAVHVGLYLLAIGLVALVALREAGLTALAATVLFAGWMVAPVFEPGPAIAALTLAAAMLWAVLAARSRWLGLFTAAAAQLVWVNVHRSFLLGPAIAGLIAVERYIRGIRSGDDTSRKEAVYTAWLVAALLGICLLNPYGWRIFGAAVRELTDPARRFAITWISPFSEQFAWTAPRWLVTGSLALMAVGLFGYQRRLPGALTTLCIVSGFAAVRSMLHVDMYSVVGFPFWVLSFQTVGDITAGRLPAGAVRVAGRLVAAVVVALSAWTVWYFASSRYYVSSGSAARFGWGVETDVWPAEAAAVLSTPSFPERVVNTASDGDYLIWALPQRKVFADSRTWLYGRKFFEELHGPILMGEEQERQAFLDKWKSDVILLNTCRGYGSLALRNLLAGGHWLLVYFDGTTALLLRSAENVRQVVPPELQTAGLRLMDAERAAFAEQLSSGRCRRNPARLIGAAQVLMSMAQYEEAARLYELLTRASPRFAGGWSNLGICYVQLGRPRDGIAALQRAVRLRPRNFVAWLWLSRAAAASGDLETARRAYQRAYRLNSGAAVAFGNPLAAATGKSESSSTNR